MKRFLVVVDMQKDFVDGSLGTAEAVAILDNVKKKIEEYKQRGDEIIFTRDTHGEDYMDTNEGKHLPVKHCVKDTEGWQVVPELMEETDENTLFIDKTHFGFDNWAEYVKEGDEVVICGTCTSICVSANVSALKMIEAGAVRLGTSSGVKI